jgi:predicted SnoaL-like aldol condensation-catalyzing enzyme
VFFDAHADEFWREKKIMVDSNNLVAVTDREFFTEHDLRTVERNFSSHHVEHSPLVANGIQGLKELVTESDQALRHDVAQVLIDGDLVASHGFYPGLTEPLPLGFDIYRIANGEIAGQQDGLVEQAGPNASGCTQLDGPTTSNKSANTEANRDLVRTLVSDVLINHNCDNFAEYAHADGTFHQHSPNIADRAANVRSFLSQLTDDGSPLTHANDHRHLADHDFVMTHSERSIGVERHFSYGLRRVEDSKFVELRNAIAPVVEDDESAPDYSVLTSVADG